MTTATRDRTLNEMRRAAGALASAARLLRAGNPALGVQVAHGVVVSVARALVESKGLDPAQLYPALCRVAPERAVASYRRVVDYMRWLNLEEGVGPGEAEELLKEAREFVRLAVKAALP